MSFSWLVLAIDARTVRLQHEAENRGSQYANAPKQWRQRLTGCGILCCHGPRRAMSISVNNAWCTVRFEVMQPILTLMRWPNV